MQVFARTVLVALATVVAVACVCCDAATFSNSETSGNLIASYTNMYMTLTGGSLVAVYQEGTPQVEAFVCSNPDDVSSGCTTTTLGTEFYHAVLGPGATAGEAFFISSAAGGTGGGLHNLTSAGFSAPVTVGSGTWNNGRASKRLLLSSGKMMFLTHGPSNDVDAWLCNADGTGCSATPVDVSASYTGSLTLDGFMDLVEDVAGSRVFITCTASTGDLVLFTVGVDGSSPAFVGQLTSASTTRAGGVKSHFVGLDAASAKVVVGFAGIVNNRAHILKANYDGTGVNVTDVTSVYPGGANNDCHSIVGTVVYGRVLFTCVRIVSFTTNYDFVDCNVAATSCTSNRGIMGSLGGVFSSYPHDAYFDVPARKVYVLGAVGSYGSSNMGVAVSSDAIPIPPSPPPPFPPPPPPPSPPPAATPSPPPAATPSPPPPTSTGSTTAGQIPGSGSSDDSSSSTAIIIGVCCGVAVLVVVAILVFVMRGRGGGGGGAGAGGSKDKPGAEDAKDDTVALDTV